MNALTTAVTSNLRRSVKNEERPKTVSRTPTRINMLPAKTATPSSVSSMSVFGREINPARRRTELGLPYAPCIQHGFRNLLPIEDFNKTKQTFTLGSGKRRGFGDEIHRDKRANRRIRLSMGDGPAGRQSCPDCARRAPRPKRGDTARNRRVLLEKEPSGV